MTQNNKKWKNAMVICYKNGYYHSNTTSNDDKWFDQAQIWIEYALYFVIQVIMCIISTVHVLMWFLTVKQQIALWFVINCITNLKINDRRFTQLILKERYCFVTDIFWLWYDENNIYVFAKRSFILLHTLEWSHCLVQFFIGAFVENNSKNIDVIFIISQLKV